MGQLSIIVADRHPQSLAVLLEYIDHIPGFEVIGQAMVAEDLLCKTVMHNPDILIVDQIILNEDRLSAMKACLASNPLLKIIFVTAYGECTIDASGVNHIGFIAKPYKIEELLSVLENAKKLILPEQSLAKTSSNKKLYIRQGANHHYVPKEALLFFEKVQHKVFIHTPQNIYETQETLDYYMEILDTDFYRSHRSYIINLESLYSIQPSGNTFLAYFYDYETPAFIAKTQLNAVKQRMNIFEAH